ncbi:MAG: hypothetical protein WCG98_00865 [bacterium]
MFTTALGQTAEFATTNPLLPLILLFIGFISTFIGNIAVAGVYSLFYSKKYYDVTKMFGLLFLTNGILFFILAPVYILFGSQIETLFVILGFHVVFSVFASACQIEFTSNPNYSGSSLMGNILGFAFALLIYGLIYKLNGGSAPQQKIYLFMIIPPLLAYTLVPLGSGIWEKIYYKFYELGNNGFYIPSPGEGQDEEDDSYDKQTEEVNVEN